MYYCDLNYLRNLAPKNPFKFNLIQFEDKSYGVRKYSIGHGYVYLNKDGNLWSSPRYVQKYCKLTLAEATTAYTSNTKINLKAKII